MLMLLLDPWKDDPSNTGIISLFYLGIGILKLLSKNGRTMSSFQLGKDFKSVPRK